MVSRFPISKGWWDRGRLFSMITKTSVQLRLCSAGKMNGQSQDFRQKLHSAEFSYINGNLARADRLLSEMGVPLVAVSAHAKTMPNNGELRAHVDQALQQPNTPPQSFRVPSVRPPCSEDHTLHIIRGGKCHICFRIFYRGSDIQG